MHQDRLENHTLHVLHIVGDPVGGIRRHVHSLINGLDSINFKISYAHSTSSVDKAFINEIADIRIKLQSEILLQVKKKPHYTDIYNIYQLCQFIKLRRVDIIHGHGAKGGLYARIAGKMTGALTVYTPHGGTAHDMFSFLSSLAYKTVERFLSYLTDYYLFESEYSARQMLEKLGRVNLDWSVNPNGIDAPSSTGSLSDPVRLMDQDRQGVTRIAVFAMLREEKGQAIAIEAIAHLLSEGENISLHLFGDGLDRNKLIEKVKEMGLINEVFFYGDVSPVYPWMLEIDLVLIPSLFESFGYVAVEALSIGKPVIATATGGLLEILLPYEDSGVILIPPSNIIALKDALKVYLRKPLWYQEGAMRTSRLVLEKYSSKAMTLGATLVYFKLKSFA